MRFKRVQRRHHKEKRRRRRNKFERRTRGIFTNECAHTQQHAFFLLHAPKRTPEDAPMKALVALITCVWCFVSNEKAFSRTKASTKRSARILNRTREHDDPHEQQHHHHHRRRVRRSSAGNRRYARARCSSFFFFFFSLPSRRASLVARRRLVFWNLKRWSSSSRVSSPVMNTRTMRYR